MTLFNAYKRGNIFKQLSQISSKSSEVWKYCIKSNNLHLDAIFPCKPTNSTYILLLEVALGQGITDTSPISFGMAVTHSTLSTNSGKSTARRQSVESTPLHVGSINLQNKHLHTLTHSPPCHQVAPNTLAGELSSSNARTLQQV